jgi:hypothetical protein
MSNSIPIKNNHKHNNEEKDKDEQFKTPPALNSLLEQFANKDKHVKFNTPIEEEEETPEDMDKIILSKEDIFVNLTLIAKIEVGDKLVRNKSDKHLNIDTSYLQFITRWFRGNSRNTSLQFINLILTKAFEINDTLLKEKNAQQLFRLTTDFKNSLNGLNNLKQTYSFDKLIQSEIDVMIDNIRSRLDFNSKNLHF